MLPLTGAGVRVKGVSSRQREQGGPKHSMAPTSAAEEK